MSTFERTLSDALRADAEQAARSTDTAAEARVLATRLDAADRARTRGRWAAGAVLAAAAVAAVVVAVVLSARPTTDVAPLGPTPSPTPSDWRDSAEILGSPSLEVPGWAAGQVPLQAPRRFVRWQQSECTSDCVAGQDQKLALLFPYTLFDPVLNGAGDIASVESFVASIDALRTRDALQVSDWVELPTANAGTAKVVTLLPYADQPAVLGCEQFADSGTGGCRSLLANTRNVVAVVDAGSAPLVVWLSARGDTDAVAQDAEMARILASLRLNGIPVSCRGLLGSTVATASCYPDLFTRIAADATDRARGRTATQRDYSAAADPLVKGLETDGELPGATGYSATGFTDNLDSSDPLATTWTLGTATTLRYVCFDGPTVTMGTEVCR